MIKKTASELSKVFSSILIVENKPELLYKQLGLPVVNDLRLYCGPLGGIHAGLTYASTPYIFVVACDMPFVDSRIIMALINFCNGYDAVVPRINGYAEPLFAVYAKNCLPIVEQALDRQHYRIIDIFSLIKVNYIDEQTIRGVILDVKRVFMNVNTPRDFAKAKMCISKN